MTAEPVEHRSHWPVPPEGGYTVDDLFTLPDLPPHTELIDGSLVFVSPQRRFHYLVIDLLVNGLRSSLGPEFSVEREMTVILDKRNGPEPDVSVVRADAVTGLDQTSFHAKDVLLAVEVVSPDSEARDRMYKPHKYATAGIPNYWRVEQNGTTGRPVIHVYELDLATMSYVHMGQQSGQIKVDKPSTIAIDLGTAERL
ncbi:Uma2 family endonuclease [Streptomyces edwardsiae]|uniref:Uma2 family endonuclease n=1 Tax=Streptomyces edwardsiae TaxID=3075527 RepID=A0ABU2PT21_9ACTN|nr:Uma2 family endonuclease [Streptomyces sp. DSM 41636]MDT0395312.1 Uma2 family endonuclease [Streptomyces sp. DSM 41636]